MSISRNTTGTGGTDSLRGWGCLASVGVVFLAVNLTADRGWAYSGGLGTLQVPYLIETAEDLIQLGERPYDYDRHFLIANDIDLAGLVFEQAVIAPLRGSPWGPYPHDPFFSGTINGNGHVIRNLQITGEENLGLIGALGDGAELYGVGVMEAQVSGGGSWIGILAGSSRGRIRNCFSTGVVTGGQEVGGLVGNNLGVMVDCYSHARVSGSTVVGGLVGVSHPQRGPIDNCYSAGPVALVVSDPAARIGGLSALDSEVVTDSFWDYEASGIATEGVGTGLDTAAMQHIDNFLAVGWDFAGESMNGAFDTWSMPEGGGYPVLTAFLGVGQSPPVSNVTRVGQCLVMPDVSAVLENTLPILAAQWDSVSVARQRGAGSQFAGGEKDEWILRVSGRVGARQGYLFALSTETAVACRATDGDGNDYPLGGVATPFASNIDCWQIFPTRPQPFHLQVPLLSANPLPNDLSELEFAVFALVAEPLVTIDLSFGLRNGWIELVPGFNVTIEEIGPCRFSIKEDYSAYGDVWARLLQPDLQICPPESSRDRRLLTDRDLIYDVSMIDEAGRVVLGGDAMPSSEHEGIRTRTASVSNCSSIESLRYTVAVMPQKVMVPITLKDIPVLGRPLSAMPPGWWIEMNTQGPWSE